MGSNLPGNFQWSNSAAWQVDRRVVVDLYNYLALIQLGLVGKYAPDCFRGRLRLYP